jgi:hypothetical protein
MKAFRRAARRGDDEIPVVNKAKSKRSEKHSENKQIAVDYKGGCCCVCGYNKGLPCLHFHHVNPNEKECTISHFASFEANKEELDKCILMCSRCHIECEYDIPVDDPVKLQKAIDKVNELAKKRKKVTEMKTEVEKKKVSFYETKAVGQRQELEVDIKRLTEQIEVLSKYIRQEENKISVNPVEVTVKVEKKEPINEPVKESPAIVENVRFKSAAIHSTYNGREFNTEDEKMRHAAKCDLLLMHEVLGINDHRPHVTHQKCVICGDPNGMEVVPSKNRQGEYFFRCYSCGQTGDVLNAMKLVKDLKFPQIIREIRERYKDRSGEDF